MKTVSINKITYVLSLICILIYIPLTAQNTTSTEEWQMDVRYLQSTIHDEFPFLFKKVSAETFDKEIEALYQELPSLEAHEIPVAFSRIISLFGYGHSHIPFSTITNGTILPINLYHFSDGVYIEGAHMDHKNAIGAKVIAIEGIPILEALEMVRPVVPVENEQYFKAFGLRFVTSPAILHTQGVTSELSETITMTLEKEGRTFAHTFPSIPLKELSVAYSLTVLNEQWMSVRDQETTPLYLKYLEEHVYYFEYIEAEKTVYARQSMVRDEKKEKIAAFYARMFDFIETHEVERLVYDVRHNGGGNNYLNQPLIKEIIRSDKINKEGNLFVITGRRTFSACQNLVNELGNYTEAIFVGEPTAENVNFYGDTKPVVLPNSKLKTHISYAWWQDKSHWESAKWTSPNIAVEMSFEDYRTNQDPVLDAVLNFDSKEFTLNPMGYLTSLFYARNVPFLKSEALRLVQDPRHRFFDFEDRLHQMAQQLLDRQQYQDGILILDLNTELFPNSANAWKNLAEAHRRGDDSFKAKTYYKKAVLLDPNGDIGRQAKKQLVKLEKS